MLAAKFDFHIITRAMTKITEDENFIKKLNQALSSSPAGMLEFLSALNIFLSITASLGNVLILVALHKVSCIHPPTKLFFRCLALADLGVGLIAQPLHATKIMSPLIKMDVYYVFYALRVRRILSWCLGGVSILTSTAISVDRLLALLLGLTYRQVVTLRRVRVVTFCIWLITASHGTIGTWRRDIMFTFACAMLIFSLVTSIFCYTMIHLKLRHQQAQVQNHVLQGQVSGGGTPLNIAKYKKSVSSILWVQLTLIACYVPWGIVVVLYAIGIEYDMALIVTETLVYLNSTLNPFLYCWKIREVKEAVKDTIRQLDCFLNN